MKKIIFYIVNSRTFKKMFGIKLHYKFKNLISKNIDELNTISEYFDINNITGTMLDVGVHYGESSKKFLEKGWKVYGFEPDINNTKKIPEKILTNTNFKLFDCAIADKPGELSFYTSDESSGISSLLNFHETHQISHLVKVETLDNMIQKHNIERFKLLKIDTEGYDFFVLKGLNFNDQKELQIILCEFEDNKTLKLGYKVEDMIKFLINQGFSVLVCEWEPIIKYGVKHTFRSAKKYPCDIDPKAWGNLIAYKDEHFEKYALKNLNRIK